MTDVLAYLINEGNPRGFRKAMKLVDTYSEGQKTKAIYEGLVAAVVNDNYDAFVMILKHFGESAQIPEFYRELLDQDDVDKYITAYRYGVPTRVTFQPRMQTVNMGNVAGRVQRINTGAPN